jgi:hypothetical protein
MAPPPASPAPTAQPCCLIADDKGDALSLLDDPAWLLRPGRELDLPAVLVRDRRRRRRSSSRARAVTSPTSLHWGAGKDGLPRSQFDSGRPLNTFWDLHHGGNDAVSIWCHQRVGLRDHFIRFIEGSGEPYSFYVQQMQALGYTWGTHYLPHDADRRFPDAEANPTIKDMLECLGLRGCEVVAGVADLTAGIQEILVAASRLTFR